MKKILDNKLLLFIPLLIIMIISLLNMQNAKLLSPLYENNLLKQLIWYLLSIVLLLIIKKVNLTSLLKYSKYFYFLSLILLLLVLIYGKNTNGAKAWFNLGIISFQPSELMKLSLTLYLSNLSCNYHFKNITHEFLFILKILIITIIPSILVFLEPDTGAIIFYFLIALSILITSKIKKFWYYLLFIFLLLIFSTFIILYIFNQELLINLIGTSFFYRVERIITFHTESSYQLENALIAIGASNLFGTGINNVAIYIPEAPTDFIFAFTISNFGYITGILILLCYLLIDIYLINLYQKQSDQKIKLITISFTTIFIFNQIINIGMNLGLLPIIGIPLPFLSYGGTTILISFFYLGVILNLTKRPKLI